VIHRKKPVPLPESAPKPRTEIEEIEDDELASELIRAIRKAQAREAEKEKTPDAA